MLPRRTLLALFLLAAAARLAHVAAAGTAQDMPGLSRRYEACATNLLAGEGFLLSVRPFVPFVDRIPGYVVLLAGMQALVGTGALPLAACHGLLGALQAPLAGALAAGARGPGVGTGAGLLVALLPPLLRSDTQLLETGAAGVALTGAALAARRLADHPTLRRSLAVAAFACLAAALRPDCLLVPVALGLALAAQPSLASRRILLLVPVLLPLVLVLPWAARNGRMTGSPFVSVGLGTNLLAALGESLALGEPLFGDQAVARAEGHDGLYWPDPAPRDAARVRRALDLIAERPGAYAVGCARRVPVLLSLHAGELWKGMPSARTHLEKWRHAHPGTGRYAGLAPAVLAYAREHPLAAALSLGWGPLVTGAALAGAWRMRRAGRDLVLLAALPAYGLAVHVPLHAEPRYFLPFVPVLGVLACVGVAGPTRASRCPLA